MAESFLRLLNNQKKKKLKPSLFQCSPDRTITNFLFLREVQYGRVVEVGERVETLTDVASKMIIF